MTTTMISNDDIRSLRREALSVGDYDMSIWCDIALAPNNDSDSQGDWLRDPNTGKRTTRAVARKLCAEAIANGQG